MGQNKLVRRIVVLSAGTSFGIVILLVVISLIMTPLSACGAKYDAKDTQVQIGHLQKEFHETLPEQLRLKQFECSGFQDISIKAVLEMDERSGRDLLSQLNDTFSSTQNHALFSENMKSRHEYIELDDQVIKLELPAAGDLYGRDITLRWSKDNPQHWSLTYHGYTW